MTLGKLLAGSLFALSALGIAEGILLLLLSIQGPKGGPPPTPIRIVGGSIHVMSNDTWTCESLQACTSTNGGHQITSYTATSSPFGGSSSASTSNPTATVMTESYSTTSGVTAAAHVAVWLDAKGSIHAKADAGAFLVLGNKNLSYWDTNCDPQQDKNDCRFRMATISVTDQNGNYTGNCNDLFGQYKCELDLNGR